MNAGNKKRTQHAPSTKTECDYLYGWSEKKHPKQTPNHGHIRKTLTQNVNPRDIAGTAEEEDEEEEEEEEEDDDEEEEEDDDEEEEQEKEEEQE